MRVDRGSNPEDGGSPAPLFAVRLWPCRLSRLRTWRDRKELSRQIRFRMLQMRQMMRRQQRTSGAGATPALILLQHTHAAQYTSSRMLVVLFSRPDVAVPRYIVGSLTHLTALLCGFLCWYSC
jgi:hypothetical protein